jgi:regulator of protease activity HflC (stomatin/prohibitin superfamily)
MAGDGSGLPANMQHSRCVQLECDTVKDAVSTFSAASMDGSGRGEIPLVLIPNQRSFLSGNGWWMTIPTGCYCLLQKFGRDVGIAPPGGSIKPPWYRIGYVVTQQSCTYNAPVKECPTSDNVRVSVDLVIVFMIRDPQAFVYRLGAVRFDQLLSGAVDEGIRILVRSQSHQTVWTLRGSKADSMLDHLNNKFEGTGVVFNNCTITNVMLPQELRQSLERTTEMRKAMEKTKRAQEFDIGEIKRASDAELLEAKRKNENIIVSEMGRKKRATLEHEEKLVNASQRRQVAVIQCEEKTKVQIAEATALLQRTSVQVQRDRVEKISKAEAEAEAKRVQADIDYEKTALNAEAEMKKLQNDAQAVKLDADAERQTCEHLKTKRKFDLDIREKDILNKLASKGNFNLIGRPGDKMVSAVMTGNFQPGSGSGDQWFR